MLHVVLYQPEIPQNTGNVGRSCVATGSKLYLVRPLGFQIEDRHLRRAGMDYWQHLDYEIVDDWAALRSRLPDRPYWYFTKTSQRCFWDAPFTDGDVLVFGSESSGLPPSILAANGERCLRIPVDPNARSLNLSVAVGVGVFEAVRQIRVGNEPGMTLSCPG